VNGCIDGNNSKQQWGLAVYAFVDFLCDILVNAHTNDEFVFLFLGMVLIFVVLAVAFIQALAAFERIVMGYINL
jgi:hypothetical protein